MSIGKYQPKTISNSINLNKDTVLKEAGSKSKAIRYLASLGYPRARIAQFLEIRYQHVRNVLEDEPKVEDKKYVETEFVS